MAERRATFAPVVLAGLAGAALAAVAGARPWVDSVEGGATGAPGDAMSSQLPATVVSDSPLATALALVVLACWGVVLVTRGAFRRGVALLGAVAGLGLAATVVSAPWTLRDDVVAELRRLLGGSVTAELTAWWWAALVAAALVVVTTAAGAVLVRSWPEMGSRYDAPADAADARHGGDRTSLDLWKALDEGRDPTA